MIIATADTGEVSDGGQRIFLPQPFTGVVSEWQISCCPPPDRAYRCDREEET